MNTLRRACLGMTVVALAALCPAAIARAEDALGLSPGATVRITPAPRVEIPGVIALDAGHVAGTTGSYERKGDLVVVQSGEQVLYLPLPGKLLRGEYAGVRGESILIRRRGSPDLIAVPRQAIARLEMQTSKGHTVAGLLGGAIAGFGFGYGLCKSSDSCLGMEGLTGAFYALPLALIGGAAGSVEKWKVVSTDKLGVTITPAFVTGQRADDGRRAAGASVAIGLRF
jgi:hypothetical protein